MLTFQVKVDLGVMSMKEHLTLFTSSELEPDHQTQFSVINKTSFLFFLFLFLGHILNSADDLQNKCFGGMKMIVLLVIVRDLGTILKNQEKRQGELEI